MEADHSPLAFTFGVLGNIISFMVYLAPLPTFRRIYRKKSTEEFQSVPYVVALFSAMLWLHYALLKIDDFLLLSINSIGCLVEIIYIVMFLMYAPRRSKAYTAKLLGFMIVAMLGIIAWTKLISEGPERVRILGWICVGFSIAVFAAPLSVIRLVIRTRSVEFMPLYLSSFLTASAVIWFCYGLFSNDIYVALPNVLGFTFGFTQIVLYVCYRKSTPTVTQSSRDPETLRASGILVGGLEVHPEEMYGMALVTLEQQRMMRNQDAIEIEV